MVGRTGEGRSGATWFGIALGVVASLPLVAVAIALGTQGWAPTGDDAVIAWRAFDVLAGQGPLVGHVNQAAAGHAAFDPGPLEAWVLALPVRLFPSGLGAVVGATLVEAGALLAAAVAVARNAGRATAAVVVAGSLLGAWTASAVLTDPVWNAHAPLVPFAAALVIGWVVACGSLRWWPVMVALATYCIQAHLVYAPASLAVVLVAPVIGMAVHRRRRLPVGWRWAAAGAGVGVVLWAVPFYQQLTGHPGNLATIWDATVGSHQPTFGWSAALNQLGRGIGPIPAWVRPPSSPTSFGLLVMTGRGVWSVAALVLLAVVGGLAVWRRQDQVVALAAIALVADIGGLWAIAGTPMASVLVLSYTTWIVWPLGMLTWFAVGWGGLRLWRSASPPPRPGRWRPAGRAVSWVSLVVLCVAGVAVGSAVGSSTGRWTPQDQYSLQSNGTAAVEITSLVARSGLAPGRLHIELGGPLWAELAPGVAYQLAVRGWRPTLSILTDQLAPSERARPGDAILDIRPAGRAVPDGGRRLGMAGVRDPDGSRQRWVVTLYRPSTRLGT